MRAAQQEIAGIHSTPSTTCEQQVKHVSSK
jgi:hypothetical protein